MAEPELVYALLSESVQALHPLPVTAEIRRLGTIQKTVDFCMLERTGIWSRPDLG